MSEILFYECHGRSFEIRAVGDVDDSAHGWTPSTDPVQTTPKNDDGGQGKDSHDGGSDE